MIGFSKKKKLSFDAFYVEAVLFSCVHVFSGHSQLSHLHPSLPQPCSIKKQKQDCY